MKNWNYKQTKKIGAKSKVGVEPENGKFNHQAWRAYLDMIAEKQNARKINITLIGQ